MGKKDLTHDSIVETAACAFRQHGVAGIGVADLMKQAGLTHGGFYAHFPSKNALIAEAADRAATESIEHLARTIERREAGQDPLRLLLNTYLSDRHRRSPERGCLLAALGSDLQRESPEVRRVATEQIKALVALLRRQLPEATSAAARERALATLAGMVGAMIVARAVDEPAFAQAMLKATRRSLAEPAGAVAAKAPMRRRKAAAASRST
ncbi:MAG: TetR/AcrR family transcriptional regulator [Nevskia sp.]